MFNILFDKFKDIFCDIKNNKKINKLKVEKFCSLVYKIFLNNDICLRTIDYFISSLREDILNNNVISSINFDREILFFFKKKIIDFLSFSEKFNIVHNNLNNSYLFVGLPGVGKTLTLSKFSNFLREKYKRNILITTCDIQKNSSIEYARYLSLKAKVNFTKFNFLSKNNDELNVINYSLNELKKLSRTSLVVDTFGVLPNNLNMIKKISCIQKILNPTETFLVVDIMCSKNIVNFYEILKKFIYFNSIIVTKVDSGILGGIFLSSKYMINKPIKFIGYGENVKDLELYNTKKLVYKFLDISDLYVFIRNDNNFDVKIFKKHFNYKFNNYYNIVNLNDFLFYIKQMKNFFSDDSFLSKLNLMDNKNIFDKDKIFKMEHIISSMTRLERSNPDIIDYSRKLRISKGSGVNIDNVDFLLFFFNKVKDNLSDFKNNNYLKSIKNIFNKFNF